MKRTGYVLPPLVLLLASAACGGERPIPCSPVAENLPLEQMLATANGRDVPGTWQSTSETSRIPGGRLLHHVLATDLRAPAPVGWQQRFHAALWEEVQRRGGRESGREGARTLRYETACSHGVVDVLAVSEATTKAIRVVVTEFVREE